MFNIHVLIPFVLALVMIAVITVASGYPYLQAKLSIIFSGGLVLVLSLVQLVKELRRARLQAHKQKKADDEVQAHSASPALYGVEAAWMIGFALAIYLCGFMIAIPLYICAYMKSHGARWRAAIMTGGGMVAFCYIIFVLVLEMNLYPGTIIRRLGLW